MADWLVSGAFPLGKGFVCSARKGKWYCLEDCGGGGYRERTVCVMEKLDWELGLGFRTQMVNGLVWGLIQASVSLVWLLSPVN